MVESLVHGLSTFFTPAEPCPIIAFIAAISGEGTSAIERDFADTVRQAGATVVGIAFAKNLFMIFCPATTERREQPFAGWC